MVRQRHLRDGHLLLHLEQHASSRYNAVGYAISGIAGTTQIARSGSGTFPVHFTMVRPETITIDSVTQYMLVFSPGQISLSATSPTHDDYFDSGTTLTATTDYTWDVVNNNTRENLILHARLGRHQHHQRHLGKLHDPGHHLQRSPDPVVQLGDPGSGDSAVHGRQRGEHQSSRPRSRSSSGTPPSRASLPWRVATTASPTSSTRSSGRAPT